MAIYRFEWDIFATDELIDEICTLAGVSPAGAAASVRPFLVRIFSVVGGLPLTEKQYAPAERHSLGRQMLHEAIQHVLNQLNPAPPALPGFIVVPSQIPPFASEVIYQARVGVNRADLKTLDGLIGIGPAIAAEMIRERSTRGPFKSFKDLDDRVDGLGTKKIEDLKEVIFIDDPVAGAVQYPRIVHAFDVDFCTVVAYQAGLTPLARLTAALDWISTVCSGTHHPYTKSGEIRPFNPAALPTGVDAAWLGVLAGSDYYQSLPGLILGAQQKIDLCMFHIALPSPGHPTYTLLDALKTAHDNGITVRVLMDQDRPDDPYKSTVINSNAKQYFDSAGIPTKYDESDRLLHSKYLIIDDSLVILGSHNWSAGSYFTFDDLSFAVNSKDLADNLRARFETIWNRV